MDLQKNKWIKRAIIIACVVVVLMIVAMLIKTAMFPPYDGLPVTGSYIVETQTFTRENVNSKVVREDMH